MAGSDVIDDLRQRRLIFESTDIDALAARLDEGPVTVYAGFDPTADSLQVGNLVPLLLLRRFQEHGHRPIALAGGATGMIGDPGGKSEERNLLDGDTLRRNVTAVKGQLERLVDFDAGDASAVLVDNRDWTEPVGVLEFLRDVGKHVTVNQMLAKESVRNRVAGDSGISYTEFSYMLLQAFDYGHLFDTFGCALQVGGSDQWGNITAGIDLIRRTRHETVHGLVVPLLTDAAGQKLGKTSAGGAVWLSADKTSPDAFYQYFVNLGDADAERVLLQLTLLPLGEIAGVLEEHRAAPEKRLAQRRVAEWMTELVHGAEAADRSAVAAQSFTAAAAGLSEADLVALADQIPTTHVPSARLVGMDLVELVVELGLVVSKSEARRLLAQAGLYVNDEPQSATRPIAAGDLLHGRYLLVRKGKRQRHLVVADG